QQSSIQVRQARKDSGTSQGGICQYRDSAKIRVLDGTADIDTEIDGAFRNPARIIRCNYRKIQLTGDAEIQRSLFREPDSSGQCHCGGGPGKKTSCGLQFTGSEVKHEGFV